MSRKFAVGVDLGATNVSVALGDEEGNILRKYSQRTDTENGAEAISIQIIKMIESTFQREVKIKDVTGVGIGSIGPLDPVKGAIINSPNVPYDFIPLVKPIKRKFGIPTYLLNDCTTAVIGEKEFGIGKAVDNLVYITLSTGIGGGAYVDGHLLLGKDKNAGEIGHFTIDFDGRLKCGCGKRGHWEAYCSGKNIPNYVKLLLEEVDGKEKKESLLIKRSEGDPETITTKMLFDTAKAGDGLSLKIVDEIGKLNAVGFGNVVNAYDPTLITVGGTISLKNTRLTLNPIKKYVKDYAINTIPNIRITSLEEDAVLYGAIAIVFLSPIYAF